MPKSVLRAVLGRMQFTLHATRRTPHNASRLVQEMSAWLVKARRAPYRHSRDARVYGHTTTAMHKLSTPPPPPSNPPPAPADTKGTSLSASASSSGLSAVIRRMARPFGYGSVREYFHHKCRPSGLSRGRQNQPTYRRQWSQHVAVQYSAGLTGAESLRSVGWSACVQSVQLFPTPTSMRRSRFALFNQMTRRYTPSLQKKSETKTMPIERNVTKTAGKMKNETNKKLQTHKTKHKTKTKTKRRLSPPFIRPLVRPSISPFACPSVDSFVNSSISFNCSPINPPLSQSDDTPRSSTSSSTEGSQQLTAPAYRRAPHVTTYELPLHPCLVHAMSAWSVKNRRAPSRHCRPVVVRLWLCMLRVHPPPAASPGRPSSSPRSGSFQTLLKHAPSLPRPYPPFLPTPKQPPHSQTNPPHHGGHNETKILSHLTHSTH